MPNIYTKRHEQLKQDAIYTHPGSKGKHTHTHTTFHITFFKKEGQHEYNIFW